MNAKALTLLVLGLLVAQECHAGSFFDDAQEALLELANRAQISIEVGVQQLDSLIQDVSVLRTETSQSAASTLAQVVSTLNTKVGAVELSASEETRDQVDYCVRLYADDIDRLPVYTQERVDVCLGAVESSAVATIEAAKAEVRNLRRSLISPFQSNIDSCLSEELCAARAFVDILLNTLEIDVKVQQQTSHAKSSLQSKLQPINNDMPACFNVRLDQATSLAELIVRYITRCVELA